MRPADQNPDRLSLTSKMGQDSIVPSCVVKLYWFISNVFVSSPVDHVHDDHKQKPITSLKTKTRQGLVSLLQMVQEASVNYESAEAK